MNVITLPTRSPTQEEVKTALLHMIENRLNKNPEVHNFGMCLATICSLENFFAESLVHQVPRFPEVRREPKAILFDIGINLIFKHEDEIMSEGTGFILDYFFSEFDKYELSVQVMRVEFDLIKNLAHSKK